MWNFCHNVFVAMAECRRSSRSPNPFWPSRVVVSMEFKINAYIHTNTRILLLQKTGDGLTYRIIYYGNIIIILLRIYSHVNNGGLAWWKQWQRRPPETYAPLYTYAGKLLARIPPSPPTGNYYIAMTLDVPTAYVAYKLCLFHPG